MPSLFRWVLAFVFLLGSPFAFIGISEALETSAQLGSGVTTKGEVTANRLVTDQRDGVTEHSFVPEVRFRTERGENVTFTDGAGSLPPDYVVGAIVDVSYDRVDPHRARLLSWKRLWLVPTIFVTVGFLPGVVFSVVLFFVFRSGPR